MKPLADEDKNFAGFIAGKLFDRSMLETTNISQGTPDNEEAIFTSRYLRLTMSGNRDNNSGFRIVKDFEGGDSF